ncbi:MAG: 3-oxoacyl-ACP reductase FabG [Acidobacteria bacterium]|nr:3-oxoacyl-ACP reductase FabG [Acidobacteriota bacterium]
MFNLAGKIAVVTGAGRGIGRAISIALAQCGATVVPADVVTPAGAAEVPSAAPGRVLDTVQMNVTDAAGVEAAMAGILEAHGRIDILVNNAGITRDQLLMRMKREDWDRVIEVNLTGAFICTQAVLRPMMKQRTGRIIGISSVVGQMGNAGQSNYAASKAALIGFSKSLAREVASRNITVNVVAPGLIDTDMTRALPPEVQTEWQSKVPLGRFGTPEDVATAVCFLASNEASYITGQILAVNGGMYT